MLAGMHSTSTLILRPAAFGSSTIQVLTGHSAPCHVTSTAACNLTPYMHTRSCNHVCGCRVHCRCSERCTSEAARRSCEKAAWSDQVPCCRTAFLCGMSQHASTASADRARALAGRRAATDECAGRAASRPSTGAGLSVLQLGAAAARRLRRELLPASMRGREPREVSCRCCRAGGFAAIAAWRPMQICDTCGGACGRWWRVG